MRCSNDEGQSRKREKCRRRRMKRKIRGHGNYLGTTLLPSVFLLRFLLGPTEQDRTGHGHPNFFSFLLSPQIVGRPDVSENADYSRESSG